MAPQWLTTDRSLIADLDPQSIEKHKRIDGIERPVLPFGDLVEDGIGDRTDQIRRHLEAANLQEMALDLAHRQARAYIDMTLSSKPGKRR